jgi:hypothetical protein
VKLRELPGAAGLGLLASLMAHAATYGHEHAMGGAYHALLQASAFAAAVGFALAALGVVFAARGHYADGSVVAARLAALLPSFPVIAVAASMWFAAGEAVEGAHAGAPVLLIALALFATTALVQCAAGLILRFINAIAVAVADDRFADRKPRWIFRATFAVVRTPEPARSRRFARPPPGAMHSACI